MTQWVETVEGGRDRGPRGLLRAWAEVMVRPERFFSTGVAPGDQAPGLVFAMVVAGVAAATWIPTQESVPIAIGPPTFGMLLSVVVLAGFVAPVTLHLVAALQTVVQLVAVRSEDRSGVGETVQVIAYATAPCIVVGLPVPALRFVAGLYAAALLAVGTAVRNERSIPVAVAISAPSAALAFGVGYQWFGAVPAAGSMVETVLSSAT